MGAIFLIVFCIICVSLADFVLNAEWKELSENLERNELFKNKNQNYGAYKIRLGETRLLLLITFIVAGICIIYVIGSRTQWFSLAKQTSAQQASEVSDTTKITFNFADTDVQLPPSSFNVKGNMGDSQPQAEDGATKDSGGESAYEPVDQTPPKPTNPLDRKLDESIVDYERRLREEYAQGGSNEAKRNYEENKKRLEEEKKAKEKAKAAQTGGKGGVAGGNSGSKGETEVTWNLGGRDAYQSDLRNVKVPAYTCGEGVNSKVILKVKVNSNGNVISAINTSLNANACCVNQAIAYAKKSRFEYNSATEQEGTITYLFKAQ